MRYLVARAYNRLCWILWERFLLRLVPTTAVLHTSRFPTCESLPTQLPLFHDGFQVHRTSVLPSGACHYTHAAAVVPRRIPCKSHSRASLYSQTIRASSRTRNLTLAIKSVVQRLLLLVEGTWPSDYLPWFVVHSVHIHTDIEVALQRCSHTNAPYELRKCPATPRRHIKKRWFCATATQLYSRDWPAGWPKQIVVTRLRPIVRFKSNILDISRNLTRCAYVHRTEMMSRCMYVRSPVPRTNQPVVYQRCSLIKLMVRACWA